MFKPKIEEYKRMYKRKGFHVAVDEAEHNPGMVPPPPKEISSSEDEEDLNENGSSAQIKRFRLKSGLALPRSLFNNREYFFGGVYLKSYHDLN